MTLLRQLHLQLQLSGQWNVKFKTRMEAGGRFQGKVADVIVNDCESKSFDTPLIVVTGAAMVMENSR